MTSLTGTWINAADGDLGKVTAAALAELGKRNIPPYVFRYGGVPAWVEKGDDGDPFAQILTPDHLRHQLARAMVWYVPNQKGRRRRVLPPMPVVKDILVTANLPLPILERIVEAPVFGPDGVLQTDPGYHAGSRTLYIPRPGFRLPPVPDEPSFEDVTLARSFLEEVLGDFPFVSDADKAHAIAFSLLPYVRSLIDGPTPLHLFEKPTPGTGATLLVEVLAYPATGCSVAAMSEGRDDEEYRKRLTSKLLLSPSFILIDNVRRPIDSAALAALLTSTIWEDRLLRHSQMVRLPVRCAWAATGNNPSLSNEIARRTVRIRMDAKSERPWLRTHFRHPDLRRWTANHRAELLFCVLIDQSRAKKRY